MFNKRGCTGKIVNRVVSVRKKENVPKFKDRKRKLLKSLTGKETNVIGIQESTTGQKDNLGDCILSINKFKKQSRVKTQYRFRPRL